MDLNLVIAAGIAIIALAATAAAVWAWRAGRTPAAAPPATPFADAGAEDTDPLQTERYALGAVLTATWPARIDTLETGCKRSLLKRFLREQAVTGPGAARAQVRILLSRGERERLDRLRQVYVGYEPTAWEVGVARFSADRTDAVVRLKRLAAAMDVLESAGIAGRTDRFRTVLSWDLVQTVAIARAAFDVGYIDREEAMGVIEEAGEMARANYHSWREFVVSALLGRSLARKIADPLPDPLRPWLEDTASPWHGRRLF